MKKLRVLLTEGSSLTAREIITCLGPLGYDLEVLDGNPFCLARFSRWTHRIHEAPAAGADPQGYMERLQAVVALRAVDVVFPTHEQSRLIAASAAETALPVAVASIDSFNRVQSKLAFARLLDEIGLPQPSWRRIASESDLAEFRFPYWLKSEFGTAGQSVRLVGDEHSRESALRLLPRGGRDLIAQQHASGQYGQAQGLFDRGSLVAAHTSVGVGVGIGGSAAARSSVEHPEALRSLAAIGEALTWHGGLTLDYMHENGRPSFIECNPRTVEPANAAASGVNLADLQVRLTNGEKFAGPPVLGRSGVRTRGTLALLLGAAARGATRRRLAVELGNALVGRGAYAGAEQLTPVLRDPPSAVPLAVVVAQLAARPGRADDLASRAVAAYSVPCEPAHRG